MNTQDTPRTIMCKTWVEAASQGEGLEKALRTTLIPRITVSPLLSLPSVKSIRASELGSGCHSEPIADSRGQGCTVGQHPWGRTAPPDLAETVAPVAVEEAEAVSVEPLSANSGPNLSPSLSSLPRTKILWLRKILMSNDCWGS